MYRIAAEAVILDCKIENCRQLAAQRSQIGWLIIPLIVHQLGLPATHIHRLDLIDFQILEIRHNMYRNDVLFPFVGSRSDSGFAVIHIDLYHIAEKHIAGI